MRIEATPVTGIGDVKSLEKVPWSEVIPAESTYELLQSVAAEIPDETAITFLPTGSLEEEPLQITFRQMFGRITQAANMFNDLGAGPTDAISFLLPLLPQAQFTLWGGEAAGIANPINFLLQPDQIAELLNAAGTKVLVALGPHPALDIWQKVEEVRDKVPCLKAILQVGGPGDEAKGVFSFDQTIAKYPADKLISGRRISRHDIASLFHTGGTTGFPKLAQHSHENEVYAAWTVANMWAYEAGGRMINGLPLFHVAGALVCSLAPLAAGMGMIIPTPAGLRNPQVIENHWRLVEKYKPVAAGGVPTSLSALLSVPVGDADISSVKYAFTGGAALPVQVERDFLTQFGLEVYQMYGATEATVVIAMNPVRTEPRIGSVGIRVPYQQWKIARMDASGSPGETCEPNETGLVMVKGPNVFPGYRDPSQNAGTLTSDNWLITGDLGYLDDEGHLFLTGRSKDLIIRSAHNIDPKMIEEAVMEHPAVESGAAVGRPDVYAGELPVVYVTLKPGASASPDELLDFLSSRISEPPAMPKEAVILDQMPMTAIGKIFKPQLRWDQTQRAFSEALSPLAEKGVRASVTVGEDKLRGTLAIVDLSCPEGMDRASAENEISGLLGQFTYVKHEIR